MSSFFRSTVDKLTCLNMSVFNLHPYLIFVFPPAEITPFIHQNSPVSHPKTLPVTASITTLPVNTVLSRPPPQVQVAPPSMLVNPCLPGLSSLATDNQLEAFLEGTLAETPSASDPRTQGLMEELQAQLMDQQPFSPMDTSELSFCDSSSSSLNMGLSDPALDNMEWLDLTMPPGPGGMLTPLGIPTDFLDTHDLHWDWWRLWWWRWRSVKDGWMDEGKASEILNKKRIVIIIHKRRKHGL